MQDAARPAGGGQAPRAAAGDATAAHQPTVDGDALFGPIPSRPSPLQPLRTGQVHKMELGGQRLVLVHLRVSIGDSVIRLVLLLQDKHNKHEDP